MVKVFILLLVAVSAFAEGKPFYGDRDRGWYAYEKDNSNVISKDNESFDPEKPNIRWDKLDTMSPERFSKLLDDTKNYALSFRTLENYQNYALLRNVAIKRAEEFASLSTLWAQMNPTASGESSYPMNVFGNEAWKEERAQSIFSNLISERENFGLIYFYSDTCPYCQRQTPVIQYFSDKYGWAIEAVNIKGSELAVRFNITTVPSVVIVERKTLNWLLVSGGIIDMTELESRLYKSIRYLKGGNESSYDISDYKPIH